jgi:hypothetical protein
VVGRFVADARQRSGQAVGSEQHMDRSSLSSAKIRGQ